MKLYTSYWAQVRNFPKNLIQQVFTHEDVREMLKCDKYINLIKSGGSDYPVNLVKKAGVDLTKKDAYLALINRIDELVDELAELLK